jgi:hypothetical protein
MPGSWSSRALGCPPIPDRCAAHARKGLDAARADSKRVNPDHARRLGEFAQRVIFRITQYDFVFALVEREIALDGNEAEDIDRELCTGLQQLATRAVQREREHVGGLGTVAYIEFGAPLGGGGINAVVDDQGTDGLGWRGLRVTRLDDRDCRRVSPGHFGHGHCRHIDAKERAAKFKIKRLAVPELQHGRARESCIAGRSDLGAQRSHGRIDHRLCLGLSH